ncbi:MAG: hypothetical protein ACE5KY_04780 [Candidatus Tectimicrobiota bacterium]
MTMRRDWTVLISLAIVLEALALKAASEMDLREGFLPFFSRYLAMTVVYLVAIYYVINHCQYRKSLLGFVIGTGAVLRVTFLCTPPVLSDDIYRYLWDGRVQRAGINPYRYPPAAPELEPLRDSEHPRGEGESIYVGINNKEIPTIYPPLMQALFAASTAFSERVLWMKGTFVLVDLALTAVLVGLLADVGLSPMRVLIYAWSPLVAVEVAGSGHNDVLALVCLLAAHRAMIHNRDTLSISLLALGGLAKLLGFAVAPLFVRSVRPLAWVAFPATVLLFALPYHDVGMEAFRGLMAYGLRWRANDSLFHLFYSATGSLDTAKAIAAGLYGGLMALLLLRQAPPLRGAYFAIGALLLLTTTLHPWYLVWIVPYLCFYPSPAWLVLTVTVALSYHAPFLAAPGEPWKENEMFKLLEYAPFFFMAALSALPRLRQLRRGARYRAAKPLC